MMSRKNIITSLLIIFVFSLERIIQVFNNLRYPKYSFETEYIKDQVLLFIANYIPVFVIIIGIAYLVLNLKKERMFSIIPLSVSLLTFLFFSQFDVFSSFVSTSFFVNYPKYEQVIELVKKDKLELVESYPKPPSIYWDKYDQYGKITNYICKLPKKYSYLAKDNGNKSNIKVLRSEKTGLIQVFFPIKGSKFSYIYSSDNKVFTGDSTIELIEQKKPNWFYVVWR